ncbi:MAG: protein kinase, partial [Rubritepida sp.]|nr:protein kinase [Rubritepida sp.]
MANEMFGKYEIRGRLGAGAMGTVFDAFDPVIERRAALKTVRRPEPDDPDGAEAMGRFKREAQAAGRLNHPHIVAVYDYGEDAQAAWIAMELVEGGTLKDPLDRGDRFPLPQTLRIMEQVLAALDYSHRRGVVHRDIKPANIMLTADGQVKIADFGIARIENSAMTQVGTIMGTPAYMAPEQLRGEAVDSRADIWAAGVVLYQLLTGEKPFAGGYSSVQHKALNTEPTPPSALSVTAPRAFDGVIARAMAKRPDDRFAPASAFAEALRGAMAAAVPEDATMVATQAQMKAPPAVAVAASVKKRQPVALIAGGAGVLAAAAAAVAAFLALGQPTPTVVAQAPEMPRPGPAAPIATGAAPGTTTAPTLAPPLTLAPAPTLAPVLTPALAPSIGPALGTTPGPTLGPALGPAS